MVRLYNNWGLKELGTISFNYPVFIHHQSVNHNTCHIVVSDSDNQLYQGVSHTLVSSLESLGSEESGDRQLNMPLGVCVDDQGRVVVCDKDNKRVVCYWWDEGEKREVILNTQQLPAFTTLLCIHDT